METNVSNGQINLLYIHPPSSIPLEKNENNILSIFASFIFLLQDSQVFESDRWERKQKGDIL